MRRKKKKINSKQLGLAGWHTFVQNLKLNSVPAMNQQFDATQ